MTASPGGIRLSGLRTLCPTLVVGLVPLAVLPGAFAPFHAGKWLAVLVLVPVGLAICALTGGLRWPLWRWFLGWLAVNAVATLLGVAPWMSLAGSPNRNAGLLALLAGVGAYVLGASTGDDPRTQRIVLRAAFLSGGVVGLLAVAERCGLDLFGLGDVGEVTRARSTWGSATFAGAHLAMVLPIAIAHLKSRDTLWRRLAAASTGAMVAGLVLTGTRGAWVAAVAAAFLFVPAWLRSARSRPAERITPSTRTVAIGLALVAAVVVALVVIVPNLGRSSGVGRIDQWRTAMPVIADRPIIGSGPDTQRVVLPSGIDESFERNHGSSELHDRVHNVALDTLVTTGVLGLAALAALGFALVRTLRGRLRGQLVSTSVASGLVAYGVTLLFAFGDPAIDPIAWLLAGLLVVAGDPAGPQPERSKVFGRVLGIGFGLVAILGAVWAGGEVLAEYQLDSAMDARARGDLPAASASLQSGAGLAPARFDLDQMAARVATESIRAGTPIKGDRPSDADKTAEWGLERLKRASRVAGDDPDVLMDRAELQTASGHPGEALKTYSLLDSTYPNSFRAQLGLGLAQAELDHRDQAEMAWRSAARLGPDDARATVNLGLLYEDSGDPDAALDWFRKALKIDPDAPGAKAGVDRVQGNGDQGE